MVGVIWGVKSLTYMVKPDRFRESKSSETHGRLAVCTVWSDAYIDSYVNLIKNYEIGEN